MPRPWAVEVHARRYTDDLKQPTGCHGLGPWRFTLVATPTVSSNRLDATALGRGGSRSSLHRRSQTTDWMPRACPVEHHARRYTDGLKQPTGCHGLVPWRFTLVATPTISSNRLDATALGRGGSRSSLNSRKRDA